jgi:hypothetical protein
MDKVKKTFTDYKAPLSESFRLQRDCGSIWGTIPESAWKDSGKSRKTSAMTAGLRAEILTRDLPNTMQEWYALGCDVRFQGWTETPYERKPAIFPGN